MADQLTQPSGGPQPNGRGPVGRWAVIFLAGPVIWYLFFWVVYLVAETACVSALAFAETAGIPTVSFLTIALTVMAAAPVVWFMLRAFRRASDDDSPHQPLFVAGSVLGVSFFIATVFVGLPALFFHPC